MRKQAFTLFPCIDIGDIRESLIDGSYCVFCPFVLRLIRHLCFEDSLDKTMDKEQVLVCVALN